MGLRVTSGAIRRMTLPNDFVQGEALIGGMCNNWRRSFHPDGDRSVEITLLYRGRPLADLDATSFRFLFEKPPHTFFTDDSNHLVNRTGASTLVSLRESLGNAANNQILNREVGLFGPRFHIEEAKTFTVSGRFVLGVTGWYHSPSMEFRNQYKGIFFDGAPGSEYCPVEEVYFQSETRQGFEHFLPRFHTCLESIRWRDPYLSRERPAG